jgi:type IV secretion system protein VirB5
LQNDFSSADTPQKKADLANQLSTEKMTLDMQIKQFDLAERQMESAENARYEVERKIISNLHKH